MADLRNKNAMTHGTIWKEILLFFFPILIGAFFQQLYNTVDAVIVGHAAGKAALASVGGSSGQILNFVFSFFMSLSAGATVIIAQFFGAGDTAKVDDALHTAYAFSLSGGLVLGAVCCALAGPLLRLLRTPSDLMDSSLIYTRVLFAGLVLTLIYNMGSGILRAVGDSKRPLYILIVCCVMNIVLDLFFVMVLRMGVLGAAVATDISQAVSAVLVTWLLMKKTRGMRLSLRRLHITRRILGKILAIGLPTALADSMFGVSNMILQTAINRMGIDCVAAWTAYGKLDAIWWMINNAFSTSIITFVGQNFGAGLPHRIRRGTRTVLAMETAAGIGMSAFVLLFGRTLLRLFTDDPGVIAVGVRMMRVIAPFYWVFAVFEILSATLRAESCVIISTVTNLIGVCLYRVVWVRLIVPDGSVEQLLACYPISWIVISVFMAFYYLIRQKQILAAQIPRRAETGSRG